MSINPTIKAALKEDSKDFVQTLSMPVKVLLILLVIIIAAAIMYGFFHAASFVSEKGYGGKSTTSTTPLNMPENVEKILSLVLNNNGLEWTWEALIIKLTILIILLLIVGDIIMLFSSFNGLLSYIIALCLILIISSRGILDYIVKIFAITAELNALGIIIVILGAIFAAITLNLGIHGPIRKWRLNRFFDKEAGKIEKNLEDIKAGIIYNRNLGKTINNN